eukprot:3625423-Prymnesium_polylepis.1
MVSITLIFSWKSWCLASETKNAISPAGVTCEARRGGRRGVSRRRGRAARRARRRRAVARAGAHSPPGR